MGTHSRGRLKGAAGAGLALAVILSGQAIASTSGSTYSFVSAPNLHPPKLQLLERRRGLAPGYFMLGVQGNVRINGRNPQQESGVLLVDNKLNPVWFSPANGGVLVFQQETYEGQPVLAWVQGTGGPKGGRSSRSPLGAEKLVVVNEHYRRIATVIARSPWSIDPHDAWIIGQDVWVPVDRFATHQNLSAYRGSKDGTVLDVGIQEYQLSTGRLLRTWDPLKPGGRTRGVPLSESEQSAPQTQGQTPWDAYHLNSVQALPDGDVLVSMRDTWAVYLINPRTDHVIWTLGGRDSTFRIAKHARFAWQHDARLIDPAAGGLGSEVKLSLFNDDSERGQARGLILRLNTHTHRATLVAAYRHHPSLTAGVEGSMQVLPNGNTLVGWGSPSAEFTEFSKSGRQLLNVAFPLEEQPYRALLTGTWVGTPYYPPSGAVRGTTVYASWNGATEVAKWAVLAGSSTTDLKVVATHSRTGFETAVKLAHTHADYEVRALSAGGQTLGTSKPFS
jgi:hypothetical protein